jgi:hypothetical protein
MCGSESMVVLFVEAAVKDAKFQIFQLNFSGYCTCVFLTLCPEYCGTRQCSYLRHYATSQKVTASIPDEVTGFFS